MTPPVITALYAALCAFIVLALAIRVVVFRFRTRTGIGDGGNPQLARAIRIHGNAIEYVPLALVLLLLAELDGTRSALLHGCGIVLVAARIAHALGLARSAGLSVGRGIGATGTFGVIAVLGVIDLAAFAR